MALMFVRPRNHFSLESKRTVLICGPGIFDRSIYAGYVQQAHRYEDMSTSTLSGLRQPHTLTNKDQTIGAAASKSVLASALKSLRPALPPLAQSGWEFV